MYKTFVDFRTQGKKYFYEGDNIIMAMRIQAQLIERYKNDNSVVAIGYEHGKEMK